MRKKNQPTVKAPLSVSLTDSPAARLLLAPGVKWRETAAPVSGRFVPVSTPNGIGTNGSPMAHALSNATHTRPLLLGITPAATLNPAVPCTARSSALGVRGASASLARWLSTCRMPRTLGARSRSAGRMCSTRTVRPRSVVRRRGVMRGSARGAVYADGDRGAGVVPQIAASDVGRNSAARGRLSSRTRWRQRPATPSDQPHSRRPGAAVHEEIRYCGARNDTGHRSVPRPGDCARARAPRLRDLSAESARLRHPTTGRQGSSSSSHPANSRSRSVVSSSKT